MTITGCSIVPNNMRILNNYAILTLERGKMTTSNLLLPIIMLFILFIIFHLYILFALIEGYDCFPSLYYFLMVLALLCVWLSALLAFVFA